jgi:peptidoglycan/LPS O-acetylase OafA/YrhL
LTSLGYRPALDGIRAIAIASVVSLHAFHWPRGGAIGVDLFFVLSGFLITALLLTEHLASGRVSLLAFYGRRARRLCPALFTLLVAWALGTLTVLTVRGDLNAEHLHEPLVGLVAGLTYTFNLLDIVSFPHDVPGSLSHLWSLAQEEQFYLLWPPVLVLLLHRAPRFVTRLLVVAIAGSLAEALAIGLTADSDQSVFYRIYFGPDTHAVPILVGCLFGVWFVRGKLPRVLVDQQMRGLAAFASLTCLVLIVATFPWDVRLYATPLIAGVSLVAAVLIAAVAFDDCGVARILAARPLRFLGRISYALYLWHPVTLHAVRNPVLGVALAVVAAVASQHLVEQRFRRRSRQVADDGVTEDRKLKGRARSLGQVPLPVSEVGRTS